MQNARIGWSEGKRGVLGHLRRCFILPELASGRWQSEGLTEGNCRIGPCQPPPPRSSSAVPLPEQAQGGLDKLLHRAIAGMATDIEALHFNKAVAKVHELVNAIEKAAPSASRTHAIRTLAKLVSPMLPHLAEEGWAAMGGDGLVAQAPWPAHDPALLVDDEVTFAIQINGKLRDTDIASKDADRITLEQIAMANTKVQAILDGATPKKVIVVPGRLVNIVI